MISLTNNRGNKVIVRCYCRVFIMEIYSKYMQRNMSVLYWVCINDVTIGGHMFCFFVELLWKTFVTLHNKNQVKNTVSLRLTRVKKKITESIKNIGSMGQSKINNIFKNQYLFISLVLYDFVCIVAEFR